MAMDVREVEYHADGARLVGTLVLPDGRERCPGVLVAPGGDGLSEHTRGVARRLAEAGYVALAMDYYGDGAALSGMDEIMRRVGEFSAAPERIRARAGAALATLAAEPRADAAQLAAIGYCFGGTTVLELARGGAELKAVVGFHSGLGTRRPQDARQIKARVLVCIGTQDPIVPPEQRAAFEREMDEAGVDWRMNLYGGAAHSFTNPGSSGPGMGYHPLADQRSWRAMLDLFDEVFVAP
jgi:dienelactone hydrolase